MNFTRRLCRGLAASLAALALLSAAARPLLACEMIALATKAAFVVNDSATEANGAHVHHAMPDAPVTPTAPESPSAPGCDHLVGCAVMVMTVAPTIASVPVEMPDAAPRSASARHDAPVRALEPPPPRT